MAEKEKNKKRSRKPNNWLLIVGAVLSLFIVAVYFVFTPVVLTTLEDTVFEETDGSYRLKTGHASFNLFTLSIEVRDVELIPDVDRIGNNQDLFLSVDLKELQLGIQSALDLISDRRLIIERLDIERPELQLFYNPLAQKELLTQKVNPDSALAEAAKMGSLLIEEFLLSDGTIRLFRCSEKDTAVVLQSDAIELELSDFSFDKKTAGYLQYDAFVLKMSELEGVLDNELLAFAGESVTLDSERELFSARNLSIKPTVDKAVYAQKRGFQQAATSAQVGRLELRGIQYLDFALTQNSAIRTLYADSVDLEIYNNHTLNGLPKKDRLLPNTWLRQLPALVSVDSLVVEHMDVLVEERAENSSEKGYFKISNINATVTNVTNDSNRISNQPRMFFKTNGTMAGGQVELDGFFELNHPRSAFEVDGVVSDLDLPEMNTLLKPLVGVVFESGKLQGYTFNMKADESYAFGKTQLFLHSVKMQYAENGNNEKTTVKLLKRAALKLGNATLQVQEKISDPAKRKGNISHYRDPKKGVFAYVFRGGLSGMLSALGVKNREDRNLPRP